MATSTVAFADQPGSGNELAPTVLTVDHGQRDVIQALGSRITADPIEQADWYCRHARSLARELPPAILDHLWKFADVGSPSGILVIRGLLTGRVPPTPLDNTRAVGARTVFAKQASVLAHGLGEMVKYEAEGHGHLLQDMVPNPKLAHTQQSQGSRVELEAHTEQCFSEYRPDYVALGCLRGDPEAKTFAFPARDLLGLLEPAEESMLRQPLWTTMIDDSFRAFVPDPDQVRGPYPILSGRGDDPVMLIDQDLMHGITLKAQELLKKVLDLYARHRKRHVLQPGDVLFLDNLRAMHGRSQFRPRFDGGDRFIVRGFVVRDRRRLNGVLGGDRRTVAARFS